jgi:hypothetical protein
MPTKTALISLIAQAATGNTFLKTHQNPKIQSKADALKTLT